MSRAACIFVALLLLSITAIGCAIMFRMLAGVWIYDSNFQVCHEILNEEQRNGIIGASRALASQYIILIICSNALWICGGIYWMRALTRNMPKPAEQIADGNRPKPGSCSSTTNH